jgi:hypothetical protein
MLSHFQGPSKGWAPSDLTTKQATALVTRNMKRASAHFLLTNSPIGRLVNKDNRSRSQSLKTLLPEGTLSVASFPCLLNSFQEIGLPLQTHLLISSFELFYLVNLFKYNSSNLILVDTTFLFTSAGLGHVVENRDAM